MNTVILYRSDFESDAPWYMLLESVGVQLETVVNGKIVPINRDLSDVHLTIAGVEVS